MKKLFSLLAFVIITTINAQAPQGFNYQATVRNSSGALIISQNVTFKFNIMLNSQTSLPVYSETHLAPTDDLGQVNLTVGEGTATIGNFAAINWGSGTYYLGIELNTGAGFVAMGTTQLLSVPYALYANSAGNSQGATPNLADVLAINNSANNTKITNLQNPTDIQDAATKGYTDAASAQLQSQIATLQAQITALQNPIVAPLPNVTIGTQIWSSTNLDVTTYRDGTPIPQVTDPTEWTNLTTGAWCYYENNTANGTTYGKLYNWYAVAGIHDNNPSTPSKILAPQGWHVPSDAEWTILTDFLGGAAVAGGKMKATGTSLWASPNTNAANEYGFTGLPGGYRDPNPLIGLFYNIGNDGYWWSSSYEPLIGAYDLELEYVYGGAYLNWNGPGCGFSVRCVND